MSIVFINPSFIEAWSSTSIFEFKFSDLGGSSGKFYHASSASVVACRGIVTLPHFATLTAAEQVMCFGVETSILIRRGQ